MSEKTVPVPIADGTVRRLFDDPEFRVAKRGYRPEDVAAFLDEVGTRMVILIGRLQGAEKTARSATEELEDHRLRTEQAETSRELFESTLALAEETANASVADAKHRATRIEAEAEQDARRMVDETRLRVERMMDAARADSHRVYEDERQAMAETEAHIQSESDQLEALRLAVAAESMALEEVRNELRRRIRRAATDLLGVAESPDCLGTPVTRGIPDVVARRSRAQPEQETSIPEAEQAPAMTEATAPEAPEPPARSIDLVEPTEGPPADDGVTVVADERPSSSVAAGDAFDRFMSDEIEEEPSRTWILT